MRIEGIVQGIETVEGDRITFSDLTDGHLANWIFHAEKCLPERFTDTFRGQLRDEASRRNLSAAFIDAADGSFMRGDIKLKFDVRYMKYVEVQE